MRVAPGSRAVSGRFVVTTYMPQGEDVSIGRTPDVGYPIRAGALLEDDAGTMGGAHVPTDALEFEWPERPRCHAVEPHALIAAQAASIPAGCLCPI